MTAYLDASALLRALLCEAGPSAPLRRLGKAYSSEIVRVEGARALERARAAGRLTDAELGRKSKELGDLADALFLVPVSRDVIALACAAFPVPVRALDALHVATAQWLARELGEDVVVWTHDGRQAAAARCRGLAVAGAD